MTRRERVIKALSHEATEIVPFNADFTMHADDNMLAHTKNNDYRSTMGMHLNYIQYWGWPTELEDQPEHFGDSYSGSGQGQYVQDLCSASSSMAKETSDQIAKKSQWHQKHRRIHPSV